MVGMIYSDSIWGVLFSPLAMWSEKKYLSHIQQNALLVFNSSKLSVVLPFFD
jgi:hypothetical protein